MSEYVLATDLELLRSYGFEAGFSGESWMTATDAKGEYWQAYPFDGDPCMVFVNSEDRASRYMTLMDFREKFGGQ